MPGTENLVEIESLLRNELNIYRWGLFLICARRVASFQHRALPPLTDTGVKHMCHTSI
jgi:hypothetical protein